MENFPSPSPSPLPLSHLSRYETRDEVIRFISSSLSSIDTDCALHNTSSKINESVDFLLEVDAIVGTMIAKFDVLLLQQTWKRLIAFFKSYHMLITSERVDRITKVLNSRACYFINALCSQNLTEKNNVFSKEAQQQNYISMVSNLQSLTFYCQRISASMAYFSMNFEQESFQISMEILFFFRGFLSYFPSSPSIVIKSEEFFWKALRSPFTATHKEIDSSSNHSTSQNSDLPRAAKRPRSTTDSDTTTHFVNRLDSASSPYKKFDRAVRRKSILCCSTFNAEYRDGDIGDIVVFCLSLGTASLASYELEKLSQEHSDSVPVPDPNSALRPVGACDVLDEKCRGNPDNVEIVLLLLDLFLFSIQKIGISCNCIGSDLAITDAIKHFLDTCLCYLDSSKERGSFHANALIVSSRVSVSETVMMTVYPKPACN